MSKIEGKAKKYDGTEIDYVSIFNWSDGKCIAQVTPDAAGGWEYEHFADLNVGITYVADGCEPITHGPYVFVYEQQGITAGYLILKFVHAEHYVARYDVNATSEPTWDEYFSQTVDIGVFDYVSGSTPLVAPLDTVVINQFDIGWQINLWGWNSATIDSAHFLEFEILDNESNVLFALRSEKDGELSAGLWYGNTLDSMGKAAQTGSEPATSGVLSFALDRVNFLNDRTGDHNESFVFFVDLSSASKIRLSASAEISGSAPKYTNASTYMRILTPE